MKKTTWLLGIVLAGCVALGGAGCKKEQPKAQAPQVAGVTVDIPKLADALANVPEANNALSKIRFGMRYGNYIRNMRLSSKRTDPVTRL